MEKKVPVYMAPLQGYTDAAFRRCHAEIYGALGCYFTPFVRVEKGEVRQRDLRDAASPLNAGLNTVPQIIFRDIAEFDLLVQTLTALGHSRIDLNMGCPFVPQVRKGRGAGTLANPKLIAEVAARMSELPGITFSVKMRLGVKDAGEWLALMPEINRMPLSHITVHPRTAAQQYAGALRMEEFERYIAECAHPVIYNGDITAPEHISAIDERYPQLAGVMIGRGLLHRPSLAAEYNSATEWSAEERNRQLLTLHDSLLEEAKARLCGDHQVLAHLLPYWEYFGTNFPRKSIKALLKSTTLPAYIKNLSALR